MLQKLNFKVSSSTNYYDYVLYVNISTRMLLKMLPRTMNTDRLKVWGCNDESTSTTCTACSSSLSLYRQRRTALSRSQTPARPWHYPLSFLRQVQRLVWATATRVHRTVPYLLPRPRSIVLG